MNKKLNILAAAALVMGGAALVGSGCSDHTIHQEGDYIYSTTPVNFRVTGDLSGNELYMSGYGETRYITVTASGSWTVSGVADWLTVEPTSGTGNGTITVTADANNTFAQRTSVLAVKMPFEGMELSGNINVYQESAPPFVEWENGSYIYANAIDTKVEIPFRTNLPASTLKASTSGGGDWLSVAISGNNVVVTLTPNTSSSSRFDYIYLSGVYDNYEYSAGSLKITQNYPTYSFDIPDTKTVDCKAQTVGTYSMHVDMPWQAVIPAEAQSWLKVTPTSSDKGGDFNVTISVTENQSKDTRATYFYICPLSDATKYYGRFTIYQNGISTSVDASNLTFTALGETKYFNFYCPVAWELASGTPTWITLTPSSGAGSDSGVKIAVSAAPNKSAQSLSGYINLKAKNGAANEYINQIAVSQSAATMSVADNSVTLEETGAAKTTTVTSDFEWKITSKPEWLTVTPESVEKGGTTTLTFTAAENTVTDARSGSVVIEGVGTLKRTITVKQNGKGMVPEGDIDADWRAQTRDIQIEADGSWDAMVSTSWLTLSQYSGTGKTKVTLSMTENTSEVERRGSLTIVAGGTRNVINVIQAGQFIHISTTSGELPVEGGNLELTVNSTVGETVAITYNQTNNKNWLTYTSQTSETDPSANVYTITATANNSKNTRSAYFTLKPGSDYTGTQFYNGVKYTITQAPRTITTTVTDLYVNGGGGDSREFSVVADGEYEITKQSGDNWYILQTVAQDTYQLVVTENTTGSTRYGYITIGLKNLPSGETLTKQIKVTQGLTDIDISTDPYQDQENIWGL